MKIVWNPGSYKVYLKTFVLLMTLVLPFWGEADIQNSLVNYLDSMGFSGNATSASAYQGQEAGYYSAGSEYLRNSSTTFNPVQLTVPSINAGCGGIDIFNGGMSFINNEQLTEFFKNTMQSAAGYLFNLALKTEVPEISEALDEAQSWAQKINDNNLTSCQLSQDMVGGLLPQTSESSRQVCRDIGTQENLFSDWTSARLNCGQANSQEAKDALNKASQDSTYQQYTPININIIWKSLGEIEQFADDHQMREFILSIVGTYIFDKDGNLTPYPSLFSDALVKVVMYGGSAKIYVCDDSDYENCLTLSQQTVSIEKDDSFVGQTLTLLDKLQRSLTNDTVLTEEEKGFLNLTTLPVLKMMTNNLAAGDQIDMTQYADLIAADMMNHYFMQLVEAVSIGASKFSGSSQEINKMVQDRLHEVKRIVSGYASSNNQAIQNAVMFMAEGQALERSIAARVSSAMKNQPAWGISQ